VIFIKYSSNAGYKKAASFKNHHASPDSSAGIFESPLLL
jgi:hypothetical protein